MKIPNQTILFLLCSLLVCHHAVAEQMPTNGVEKKYYDDGSLLAEFPYKDGQLNGVVKGYYPSGALKLEAANKNDKPHGVTKEYYESGVLGAVWNYQDGKLTGEATKYYETGEVFKKMKYIDGIQSMAQVYYRSGPLKRENRFTKSGPHGVVKYFSESGAVIMECMYRDGKQVDSCKGYTESGDHADGLVRLYNSAGQLETEFNFVKGIAHGPFKAYFESGSVNQEGEYRDGYVHGVVRTYDESGTLLNEDTYQEGVLEGPSKVFDVSGKLHKSEYKNWRRLKSP